MGWTSRDHPRRMSVTGVVHLGSTRPRLRDYRTIVARLRGRPAPHRRLAGRRARRGHGRSFAEVCGILAELLLVLLEAVRIARSSSLATPRQMRPRLRGTVRPLRERWAEAVAPSRTVMTQSLTTRSGELGRFSGGFVDCRRLHGPDPVAPRTIGAAANGPGRNSCGQSRHHVVSPKSIEVGIDVGPPAIAPAMTSAAMAA